MDGSRACLILKARPSGLALTIHSIAKSPTPNRCAADPGANSFLHAEPTENIPSDPTCMTSISLLMLRDVVHSAFGNPFDCWHSSTLARCAAQAIMIPGPSGRCEQINEVRTRI